LREYETERGESIISKVSSDEQSSVLVELVVLLQDAVNSGASVGFLPPLSTEDAETYWRDVFRDVEQGDTFLLVARTAGQIVGSVQLALASKPNARHRAEVQKLFVLQIARRRGIAQDLMQAIEEVACKNGRSLLVLDTRQDGTAEELYRKIGYLEAGVIPGYCLSSSGQLDSTVIFYKTL
jgi:ribosomal protein S18 acetylase RimI-like enzyme